jgi:hypothetical protein
MWTEVDIAQELDGHFWTYRVSDAGKPAVVDILKKKEWNPQFREDGSTAAPWTDADIKILTLMKRAGQNSLVIAAALGRSHTAINQMWSKRDQWASRVFARREVEPTMREIASAVCDVWKIGELDLMSDRRTTPLAEARQVFYWICKNYTSRPTTQIGAFARRDHSTVIHGIQKIDQQISKFRPKLEACLVALDLEFKTEKAA